MTLNDLGDMQRYLVEEEAEHWRDGTISRREFIRRVTLLVGGAAAASGVLLSLGCDPTSADATPTRVAVVTPSPLPLGQSRSPYHVADDDPAVHTEMVDIPARAQGLKLKGYLAYNQVRMGAGAGPAKPGGVLVMHENRGLTDYIKDVVRRLGKAGYVALCVDLLSRAGGTSAHPDEAERIATLGQVPVDYLLGDLLDGVAYLGSRPDVNPGKLGAVGFCFGGGMTWRLVTQTDKIKAAVPFYGPNPPLSDVPKIKAAMLGIYGGLDERITGQVPQLEQALKQANVTYEIQIYPGANHAFHNDTGPNYDAEAAKDAWTRTMEWLGNHM